MGRPSRRHGWIIGCVALLIGTGAGLRVTAGEAPTAKPARLHGYFVRLAEYLGMSDGEKEKMAGIVQERTVALQNWDQQNAAKLKEASDAYKTAQQTGDKQKTTQLQQEIGALRQARRLVYQPYDKRILDNLAPAQRPQYYSYFIHFDVTSKLRRTELTDDQKTKLRALCDAFGTEVEKAGIGADDVALVNYQQRALEKAKTEILDAAQQAALNPRKNDGKPETGTVKEATGD